MKIPKAIEVLTDILTFVQPGDPPEEHEAIKLGIEGLKRLRDIRHFGEFGAVHPLPGETKE